MYCRQAEELVGQLGSSPHHRAQELPSCLLHAVSRRMPHSCTGIKAEEDVFLLCLSVPCCYLYCPQKQLSLSHLISQTLCRQLSSESQTWQHPVVSMGKAAPAQWCFCSICWTWRYSMAFTPPSHLCQAQLCKGFRDRGCPHHFSSPPITCAIIKVLPGAEPLMSWLNATGSKLQECLRPAEVSQPSCHEASILCVTAVDFVPSSHWVLSVILQH